MNRLYGGLSVDDVQVEVIESHSMTVTGVLAVAAGQSRIYFTHACEIESVVASVNAAPAGSAVIVDVNRNGTSIYTNQANRPTIAAGTNKANGGTPDVTTFAVDDYLTMDVDQVGATSPGTTLTVTARFRRVA